MLPAGIYPNSSARRKHRTLQDPWPDSCTNQQQPTLLHCSRQGSHVQTLIQTASTHNIPNDKVAARAEVDQMMPQQEACSMQDMFCFAALANANTGTMYTDLTGSFPVRSFKNMQYIFVAYVYDLNAIILRAMPTRTNTAIIMAFKEVIMVLRTRGYRPALNAMDNKCSTTVEQYIRSEKINIQLVPPHNH